MKMCALEIGAESGGRHTSQEFTKIGKLKKK